jgi:SAM-dependent methyltransferase
MMKEETMDETVVKRLHWGCGSWLPEGWINSDQKDDPGIDISCDILDGLPLETGSMEYAVSIHALPEVPYPDLVPVLEELRRVLEPGGVLRLGLPDLGKTIEAYIRKDTSHFAFIPDEDAAGFESKFITHLVWYGYTRTFFTPGFIEETLTKARFSRVVHCEYKKTASGHHPDILDLDNRENESLFVEAFK